MSSLIFDSIHRHFSTFFPPACAGCDGDAAAKKAFCTICAPAAFRLHPPYCDQCRVPMDELDEGLARGRSLCSRCRREPPNFKTVWAPWEYEGAVADAIRRIKYASDFPALRALCREAKPWFAQILSHFPANSPLIPIPSHTRELRRRGFHLPSLILRFVEVNQQTNAVDHRLIKTRPTKKQASLPVGARRKNVADIFCARSKADGGTAVIVDDVMTTGATADAAAEVLLACGFDDVAVIVLARAPKLSRR